MPRRKSVEEWVGTPLFTLPVSVPPPKPLLGIMRRTPRPAKNGGKPNYVREVYVQCPNCGLERWAQVRTLASLAQTQFKTCRACNLERMRNGISRLDVE